MLIIQQTAKRCIDTGNDTIALQQIILEETIPSIATSLMMKLRSQNNVSSADDQPPKTVTPNIIDDNDIIN